eukprot:6224723-Ditylum_brightwellii.AAC.1
MEAFNSVSSMAFVPFSGFLMDMVVQRVMCISEQEDLICTEEEPGICLCLFSLWQLLLSFYDGGAQ